MNQRTLFDRPAPVAAARARGLAAAEACAGAAGHEWNDQALDAIRSFVRSLAPGATFLAEHAIAFSEETGRVPAPRDRRAWGSVMQRARRLRLVVAAGYAPSASSNGSPKVLWRAAR